MKWQQQHAFHHCRKVEWQH